MQIGSTVSHYRVLEQLGAGGMGVVFKAEDVNLGRCVALKFLPPGMDDAGSIARFRAEARSLSVLNHPNICIIHEIGEHEGRPFMAMELLDGRPLHRVIGGEPVAPRLIVEVAAQVADALQAAHSAGLVHRDIKPANIFLTPRGQAKVLDFGLAKLSAESPGGGQHSIGATGPAAPPTASGMTMGTVAYMSPEQARGELLDGRSDIFSLGLVLYEMATGRQTFEGNTAAVVFDALLNRAPVPAGRLTPSLPGELERIIHRAIEKDRRFRYQTASDMRTDLQRLLRDMESGQVMPTSGQLAAVTDAAAEPMSAVNSRAVARDPRGTSPASSAAIRALELRAAVQAAQEADRQRTEARASGRRVVLIGGAALLVLVAGIGTAVLLRSRPAAPPLAPVTTAPLPASSAAPGGGRSPAAGPSTPASPAARTEAAASSPAAGEHLVPTPSGTGDPVGPNGRTPPAAAAGAPLSTRPTREGAAVIEIARAKIERKLYDQAVADLRAFVDKRPNAALAPEAVFLIADARRVEGRRDEAMGAFVELGARYASHPRAAEGAFRLAQLTAETGRPGSPEEARASFGSVAQKYPTSPWAPAALMEKATIEDRMKVRQIDAALQTSVPSSLVTLRALVESYPAHALAEQAHWKLADLYEGINRHALAAEECETLAKTFPSTKYDAWFRAGELFDRRVKDKGRARAAYAQVPPTSPRYRDAQKRSRQ